MDAQIRIALIGLDTSHAVEFPKLMQAPDCPADLKVAGMKAVTCLRFPTPFHNEEGQDKRQKQLESWGIRVTRQFEEAVADCDAIMLEINDPAFHREYFEKCAGLGKPVFVDKPLADTHASARAMLALAASKSLRVMSASSLRFAGALVEAVAAVPRPLLASTYGPLGKAPAGSSIVWYGVHAFEMLERAMGRGAAAVTVVRDPAGVVCVIEYATGQRGVVELTEGNYQYGGCLRDGQKAVSYRVDAARIYKEELDEIARFFHGQEVPVTLDDAVEVTAMLDAAEHSFQTGQRVAIDR